MGDATGTFALRYLSNAQEETEQYYNFDKSVFGDISILTASNHNPMVNIV